MKIPQFINAAIEKTANRVASYQELPGDCFSEEAKTIVPEEALPDALKEFIMALSSPFYPSREYNIKQYENSLKKFGIDLIVDSDKSIKRMLSFTGSIIVQFSTNAGTFWMEVHVPPENRKEIDICQRNFIPDASTRVKEIQEILQATLVDSWLHQNLKGTDFKPPVGCFLVNAGENLIPVTVTALPADTKSWREYYSTKESAQDRQITTALYFQHVVGLACCASKHNIHFNRETLYRFRFVNPDGILRVEPGDLMHCHLAITQTQSGIAFQVGHTIFYFPKAPKLLVTSGLPVYLGSSVANISSMLGICGEEIGKTESARLMKSQKWLDSLSGKTFSQDMPISSFLKAFKNWTRDPAGKIWTESNLPLDIKLYDLSSIVSGQFIHLPPVLD